MRSALRRDLLTAMKARDPVSVSALRSALAAIENAESVDVAANLPPAAQSSHVAGAVAGLGSAEVERRVLSDDDVTRLVRNEVTERQSAAADFEHAGHLERAARLRAEADVLRRYLLQ